MSHECPTCGNAITEDMDATIRANDEHETAVFRVQYIVDLINENKQMKLTIIEMMFDIFDSNDNEDDDGD